MILRKIVLTILACALPLLGALDAESAHRQKPERQAEPGAPPKDCTRYNSRYGFYGNIWCTPAEQERWDRWDAARFMRTR
jgi:predicted dehydrogenase